MGRRALADGGYDGALKIFNQIVIVAPDFSEAWNKRATVLYLMGDFAGSVRNIESTLALEPRHFGALSGLGLIYRAIDKPESALKVFEKTLEIHPRSANAREQIRQIREELAERRL